jgi:hypothetical protein
VLLVADDRGELVATRLAPPTSAPSTSGSRMKLAMLPDFTDPP